jgi:hypothetical protein
LNTVFQTSLWWTLCVQPPSAIRVWFKFGWFFTKPVRFQARAKVLELYKTGRLELSAAMELLSDPNASACTSLLQTALTGDGGTNKRSHDETGEDSESDDEQQLIDTLDTATSSLDAYLFLETYVSRNISWFCSKCMNQPISEIMFPSVPT